jgi:hypothetical protein
MRIRCIAFAIVGLAILTPCAHAASVTYVETTTASGSLGGSSFTNALVTMTAIADTANVMPIPLFNALGVDDESATVSIAGLGTATFTGTAGTHFFVNHGSLGVSPTVGLAAGSIAAPRADILDVTNPVFSTYGLTTSFGPVSGTTSGGGGGAFSFATSSGPLFFDAFTAAGTFQATVVPEPSSLVLTGIAAVAGMVMGARRRASR